jgi:uncharacterized protein with HEPN domain
MKTDQSAFLNHILDAIKKIEKYTQGIDEETFKINDLVQDGVIRQIEIIGEAVKRLSNELTSQYSHIPWQDIAGMRDKLIHDYFGVDLDTVWLTVEKDIPELKEEIKRVIENLD